MFELTLFRTLLAKTGLGVFKGGGDKIRVGFFLRINMLKDIIQF